MAGYCDGDPFQESMLESYTLNHRDSAQGQWTQDQLTGYLDDYGALDQNYTYNFMSKPLSEDDEQYVTEVPPGNPESNYPDVHQYKEYAYWGQTKYFQQKAVVDRLDYSNGLADLGSWPHGRISYTDYYTNTAAAGSRGQTYKTYSDPYVPTWTDAPVSSGTQIDWQDELVPNTSSGDPYSSETVYDSYGRATDVYKMAPSTVVGTFPYSYVHTQTVYGANNSTWWGEPETVTEDAGGINRVTQTLAYDSSGHATETEDAAGHVFLTSYLNQDYQVSNITETDCTPNQTLVSYTYGTTPGAIDYGQVDSVTDGLSGVEDSFTYDGTPGDPGIGQASLVTESGGPWGTGGYSVAYTYTADGDRETTTYTTANGTNEWQYDNYCSVGMPQNGGTPSRAPQTMRQIVSGSPTGEEFHYQYDGGGRLMAATFAMTPASGYTPSSGQPWYTPSELPSTRARVVYDNDGGNQLLNLDYYWDNWNSSGSDYNSANIFGNVTHSYSYTYDVNTWLKTQATLNDFNPHTENYYYGTGTTPSDPYGLYCDYLTEATNAGNDGVSEYWTYDPAGNRHDTGSGYASWTYDDLNRLTTSPGCSYTNDILGNRDSNGTTSNVWDQLNRMTKFTASNTITTNYSYRANGMRVLKSDTNGNSTSFAYDGQVGFEDVEVGGSNPGVTDYAIGGRGIDRLAFTSGSNTSVSYPVLDGHGNMTATLSESGSGYSTGNSRSYDAWGNVIVGSGGDPKGRYCANLGHKQDDESGLIYMGARYYDPGVGRFVSEDDQGNGKNWFSYAANEPTNKIDASGCDAEDTWMGLGALFLTAALVANLTGMLLNKPLLLQGCVFLCALAVACFMAALNDSPLAAHAYAEYGNVVGAVTAFFFGAIALDLYAIKAADTTIAATAVNATFGYMLTIMAALAIDDGISDDGDS